MTAPRKLATALVEDVPGTGESVLVDPESGKILALNPTAAAVWDLLDGHRDAERIAAALSEATGVDAGQATRDVDALLQRLRSEGFLVDAD